MSSRPASSRSSTGLLIAAPFVGLAALGAALYAYHDAGLLAALADEGAGQRLARWVDVFFDAAAVLVLDHRATHPDGPAMSVARALGLAFVALGASGVVLELSRSVRHELRRLRVFGQRLLGRRSASVVGLGWVGGPLAEALAEGGGPVLGVTLDQDTPSADRAWGRGVLVVSGDAHRSDVRDEAGLTWADEIFVASGDDARNIDLAGELLGGARGSPTAGPVGRLVEGAVGLQVGAARWLRSRLGGDVHRGRRRCYVHVGDPDRSLALERHALLSDPAGAVRFHLFSTPDLAARDLFLMADARHEGLLRYAAPGRPEARAEVFHLFVFGTGSVARAVALHLARFAHFPCGLRPRLTVWGGEGTSTDEGAGEPFLERHPAFSPADLDLAARTFLGDAGDDWRSRPGRPASVEYCKEPTVDRDDGRRVRPVEYAVNAEYRTLDPREIGSSTVVDALMERLRPGAGPPVRGAVVLCYEEEQVSLDAALALQYALVRRSGPEARGAARTEPVCPLYVYLPVEEGFSRMISERRVRATEESDATGDALWKDMERRFPLRPFGERGRVNAPAAITGRGLREHASAIKSAHRILARRQADYHPDFDSSDFDAVVHALYVKAPSLGIEFVDRPREGDRRVLGLLINDDVRGRHRNRRRRTPRGPDGRLRFSKVEFEGLRRDLRLRLALFDDVYVPPEGSEAEALRASLGEAICEVVDLFREELRDAGLDDDLPAAMEHNRWLGERLAKGWQFGPRSDPGRRRLMVVPWQDLSDEERLYDRVHLPRLLVEKSESGLVPVIRGRG